MTIRVLLLVAPLMATAAWADDLREAAPLADRAASIPSDQAFEPYPDKADMLVVVAHPDDESTFGGLLPYYALCRHKKIVFVSMTSGEWGNGLPHHRSADQPPDYSYDDADVPRFEKIPANALYPSYYREGELKRMLHVAGVWYAPVLPRYRDMTGFPNWGSPEDAYEYWGGKDKVVGTIVRQIRRFRPDVVVTMAFDGHNGNPIHLAACRGTLAAAEASGDADADHPHQPWSPKKVYMAVTEGRETYDVVHTHSWEHICDGHDIRAVAGRANAQHESQGMKNECPASTDFVLKLSTVGPDVVGRDDLFENVPSADPQLGADADRTDE